MKRYAILLSLLCFCMELPCACAQDVGISGQLVRSGTLPASALAGASNGDFPVQTGSTWAYNGTIAAGTGLSLSFSGGTFTLSLSTPVSVANGGTGLASYTTGDLLVATGSTTLASLSDVATGSLLVSKGIGVAPAWGSSLSATSLTLSGSSQNAITASGTPNNVTTNALMRLGNTITGGNANGTYFGINEPNSGTASTADFFDFQNNGTIEAELSYQGILTAATWEGNKIGAAYGGTGSSSVPSSGQILVGNSGGTAYAPQTVSGDGSVTAGGVWTNTGIQGVAVSSTAPTSGEVLEYSSGSSEYVPTAVSGSGTVTTFSSGNLSPLFTTSVSSPTTTPSLSYSLSNAAGDSWFGNASGSSGAPSYNTGAVPIAMGGTGTTSTPTSGDLLIGTSGGGYSAATLTAGSNVTITNSSGGITIASSGGGGGGSLPTDYISGCVLTYDSTTAIQVSTGTAYNPIDSAADTISSTITYSPTLSASTLYYVYLASGGTSIVTSTTAPATNYQGSAREDSSDRRYLGSFITDSSSHILPFVRTLGTVYYEGNTGASPFTVLSGGTATSSTAVSLAGVVPVTALAAGLYLGVRNATATGSATIGNVNNADILVVVNTASTALNTYLTSIVPIALESGVPKVRYITTGSPPTSLNMTVISYVEPIGSGG